MPEQKGHLHDIPSDTKWSHFVTLVTDKFQPTHATHDLLQCIRLLKMKTYQLQTYVNDLRRLKRLISSTTPIRHTHDVHIAQRSHRRITLKDDVKRTRFIQTRQRRMLAILHGPLIRPERILTSI